MDDVGHMTRVAVLASDQAARARLRGLVSASGIEIAAEVAEVDHEALMRADVVLVAGGSLLRTVLDRAASDGHLAVVAMTDRPDAEADAARSGVRGWAVLPVDADASAVRAAVLAADAGLAVRPVSRHEGGRRSRTPALHSLLLDGIATEALTPREQEVLDLLSVGHSNRRIAERLGISAHTVKFHVAAIYAKLGVSGRAAAVSAGVRKGLVKI